MTGQKEKPLLDAIVEACQKLQRDLDDLLLRFQTSPDYHALSEFAQKSEEFGVLLTQYKENLPQQAKTSKELCDLLAGSCYKRNCNDCDKTKWVPFDVLIEGKSKTTEKEKP